MIVGAKPNRVRVQLTVGNKHYSSYTVYLPAELVDYTIRKALEDALKKELGKEVP